MKWEKKKLCECTEYITDGDHQPVPKADKGVHFIKIKDIVNNQVSFDAQVYVPQEYYDNLPMERKPQKEDVLYTVVGSFGIPSYVQTDELFCFERNIALLHPNKDIEPRFLYYSLKNPAFYKGVEIVANGSAQKLIPLSKLKDLKISVPDKEAQHRIADILSVYDNLIENNQKQIKLLEEAAQRLYKEWFVDLRFPGYENTKIVDGVPEGWNECTVESFGTVITGKTPPTSNKEYYTNGKVPFVTIPDMHNVVYPLKTEKRLTIEGAQTQKNKYIPPNSVMISCIGTVGLVSIATEVCQTNQQINSIILNNEDDLYFFYESMLRMKDLLDGLGSNGATMTNVNKSKLEKLIIISPSKDIVKQYNDVCKPLFESALNLSRKNVYLKNMREALLPKLMSGEVEV